jgi:hypothetical protein
VPPPSALIVAHRSHAQAIADGEVALSAYPHREDSRFDLTTLAAVHGAISPDVDAELARQPYNGTPEAEGGDGGWAVWRLPDDLLLALTAMDAARKRQAMTRLQGAPEMQPYDPSPARLGTLLDDLSHLTKQAMSANCEMWVRIPK